MQSLSATLTHRESWWPDNFDDREIDDLIWAHIARSHSRGDFACYLVHRLLKAQHLEEAQARYESIDPASDPEPLHYPVAIEQLRRLAESGHAGALFHMGKVYALGIALEQDFEIAAQWYQRAVHAGDMRAHCNLGWMYQSGSGVTENKVEAFRLLSIGAEHGVLSAKAAVGVMLLNGEGCNADAASGLSCLQQAFDAGYSNAGNCLADVYLAGKQLPLDVELGHAWLASVAEERNDARSQAILGHYLVTGSHGKTDVPRGLALLQQSIEGGYAAACLWLGALYEKGQGVAHDAARAQLYYERGVSEGEAGCAYALMRLSDESVPSPDLMH